MKLIMLEHTPNPEKVISAAAKLCYSSASIEDLTAKLTPKEVESFLTRLMSMGHESPLEHVSFTFAVEGVSRITEQQLTRHRIASYSIQSGRYVNRKNAKFTIPPQIKNNSEAIKIYKEQCDKAIEAYNKLSEILIKDLMDSGIKEADAKKKAIEDARYIFPNSLETKIIFTMNARSLINFFNHRCCNRAQWEIRELAFEMLKLCKEIAPTLFKSCGPACISGKCPEGALSCGKQAEMLEKVKGL